MTAGERPTDGRTMECKGCGTPLPADVYTIFAGHVGCPTPNLSPLLGSDESTGSTVFVVMHSPGLGKRPYMTDGPFLSRAELEQEVIDYGVDDRDEVVEMTAVEWAAIRGGSS